MKEQSEILIIILLWIIAFFLILFKYSRTNKDLTEGIVLGIFAPITLPVILFIVIFVSDWAIFKEKE